MTLELLEMSSEKGLCHLCAVIWNCMPREDQVKGKKLERQAMRGRRLPDNNSAERQPLIHQPSSVTLKVWKDFGRTWLSENRLHMQLCFEDTELGPSIQLEENGKTKPTSPLRPYH
jgi:predicted TIM-barrel fold metal-dependent hydrolase